MFVALIAESVLRNNVGGAQVMADQLDHIAQMAQHENVVVQVIPDNARSRDVLIAPFVIACMDSVNIAYVDNQLNGEVIEDADDVARLLRMFDRVRADALSQQESIALIARMADKWRS